MWVGDYTYKGTEKCIDCGKEIKQPRGLKSSNILCEDCYIDKIANAFYIEDECYKVIEKYDLKY